MNALAMVLAGDKTRRLLVRARGQVAELPPLDHHRDPAGASIGS